MKVKIKPLIVNNLLLKKVKRKEEIFQEATKLLRYVIGQECFPTGPVIYTTEKQVLNYVGVQINDIVDFKEEEDMKFYKELRFEQCAFIRILEDENSMEEGYEEIQVYVKSHGYECSSNVSYYVVLDVYGSVITDLYVPVKERSHNDSTLL